MFSGHSFPLLLLALFSITFMVACQPENQSKSWHKSTKLSVNGSEPRIHQDLHQDLWLSWTEERDSTNLLWLSSWNGATWNTPKMVSQGSPWFVNWADFPGVYSFSHRPKSLFAWWLTMSGEGTYDYNITYAISKNAGADWTVPQILHQDEVAAEHGFVSVAARDTFLQVVWLDGRNTKSSGPMSLRTVRIQEDGRRTDTLVLDGRVCDCCQTAIVSTKKGFVVAYRDRSEDEIRDISLIRYDGEHWSEPYQVHPDNWNIAGCPVNGPVLVSRGDTVALAWFSGAQEGGLVYLSYSTDGGQTFGSRIQVTDGPTLGRIDLAMDTKGARAFWIDPADSSTLWRTRAISYDGELGEIETLQLLNGGRNSGFPKAIQLDEDLLTAFTVTSPEGIARVGSVRMSKGN